MRYSMIEIVKCSEYNVRAMKQPDFKSKICGFNFSYQPDDLDNYRTVEELAEELF